MKKSLCLIFAALFSAGMAYGQDGAKKYDSVATAKMMRELYKYYHRLSDKEDFNKVNWEIVTNCLRSGAEADARDANGITPVQIAAYYGDIKAIQIFLEHGANVNLKDYKGYTPMHFTAFLGQAKAAEMLLKHGADINASTNGVTPIALAAFNKKLDIVKYLLKKGADVKPSGLNVVTPLHFAAQYFRIDLAKLLINAGADVNAIDKRNGQTPLVFAIVSEYYNGKNDSTFISENYDMVKFLIEKGAITNLKTKEGDSPLILACKEKQTKIAGLLIDNGAMIDAKDSSGMTALFWACIKNDENTAELLLEKDADVNAKRNDGRTPLDAVVWPDYTAVGKILFIHRAKHGNQLK